MKIAGKDVQNQLVSGVNIKTINSTSLLGADNLTVGGLPGVHAVIPLSSSEATSLAVNALAPTSGTVTTNRIIVAPFIPAQSFTISNFVINVPGTVLGATFRIIMYSDLNGKPDRKLFESTTIDGSTIGMKIVNTTFDFVAGTTYWLGVHFGSTSPSISYLNNGSVIPIRALLATNFYVNYYTTAVLGSAPNPFGVATPGSSVVPNVLMLKA